MWFKRLVWLKRALTYGPTTWPRGRPCSEGSCGLPYVTRHMCRGSPQVRSCWAVTRKFPRAQNKVWHRDSEARERSVCIWWEAYLNYKWRFRRTYRQIKSFLKTKGLTKGFPKQVVILKLCVCWDLEIHFRGHLLELVRRGVSQFKELKIYGGEGTGQNSGGSSAPAAVPGSAPVCSGGPSAGDKRRVGVLMMLQAQLSYSCVTC